MRQAGLADDFVAAAIHTAVDFDGVYDLVLLWGDEEGEEERGEIVTDIHQPYQCDYFPWA